MAEELAMITGKNKGAQVIGPAPAYIGKVNDIYRQVFYVKSGEYPVLIRIKDELEEFLNSNIQRDEMVQFDFDPMNMF